MPVGLPYNRAFQPDVASDLKLDTWRLDEDDMYLSLTLIFVYI